MGAELRPLSRDPRHSAHRPGLLCPPQSRLGLQAIPSWWGGAPAVLGGQWEPKLPGNLSYSPSDDSGPRWDVPAVTQGVGLPLTAAAAATEASGTALRPPHAPPSL